MFSRFLELERAHSDRVAVTNEASSATYGELARWAESVRGFLGSASSRPHVLLALPGGPEFTAVQLGALGSGAVLAPISDKSTTHETQAALGIFAPDVVFVESLDAQAPLVAALDRSTAVVAMKRGGAPEDAREPIGWSELLDGRAPPLLSSPQARLPGDVRLVQFTSGSTAAPKGIALSNANLTANLDANREHLASFRGEPVFCPVPQFHAMGGAVVLEHLFHGSPVHVANQFVPSADSARMQSQACAALLASPNYFKMLLRLRILSPRVLPLLRAFTIGTASIDPELVEELHAAYPEATVHCRYGLTESMGALTRLDLRRGDPFGRGLLGSPVPGVEVLTTSSAPAGSGEAELLVRGPCTAVGQLVGRGACEPLTDADGYLHTGDTARVDERGFIHLAGRLSAFLKSNGHRVNPFEIEAVLRSYSGVQEAVVVGVPDPMSGQRIVACVEPAPGISLDDPRPILAHCRAALSPYKVPQRVVVVAELPRTRAGKPDRSKVLAEIAP